MNESTGEPVARSSPWPARLHTMAVGVAAGFLIGVPLGLLNRLYQRITAIMEGGRLGFSWAGTAMIVLITVLPFALPSGLLFTAVVRRRLWGSRLVQGASYGLLLLCVLGLPYLWAGVMGLNTTGDKWVNRLMYGSLFVLQGLALPFVVSWLERRLPLPQGRWGLVLVYGLLALLGLGGGGLLLILAFAMLRNPG